MARRDERPGDPRSVMTIRMGEDERQEIERAAAKRGEPLTTFIRGAALSAAKQELTGAV